MQSLASGNFLEIGGDVAFRWRDNVPGVEEVENRGIVDGFGFEDGVVTSDGKVVKSPYEVYAG